MIIKIKKGVIYSCEEGMEDTVIGTLLDTATFEEEKVIECGAAVLPVVKKFIDDVNSGSFKPRTAVKELELVLHKYAV